RLAERAILDALDEMHGHLDHPAYPRPRLIRARVVDKASPLLNLLGATGVLATACLPVPRALVASLVLASEIPALLRGAAAVRRRRLDGHALEAATLMLLTARGNYVSSAL